MQSKECFGCKKELTLDNFYKAEKFLLKCDLGTVRVCKKCLLEKAIAELSVVAYNKKFRTYDVFKFNNKEEVILYFERINSLENE